MNFSTEQIVENTLKTKELLERAFKVVFGRVLEFQIEDTSQDHNEFELTTDKEDVMLVVDYTGQDIMYYPQGIKHDPGVYMYSDGSGEPPSDEPFDLLEKGTESVRTAIETMLVHVRDYEWQGAMEAFQEMLDFPIEHEDECFNCLGKGDCQLEQFQDCQFNPANKE